MDNILPDLRPLCVPTHLVEEDPNNANVHPREQVDEIVETLSTFGLHTPLVVREKGPGFVCIVGSGRLRAAKLLGWEHIPVVRTDDPNHMAVARAIRDNTLHEGSHFDMPVLRGQLRDIRNMDEGLALILGWDGGELEKLLDAESSKLSEAMRQGAEDETNATLELSRLAPGEDDVDDDYEPPPAPAGKPSRSTVIDDTYHLDDFATVRDALAWIDHACPPGERHIAIRAYNAIFPTVRIAWDGSRAIAKKAQQ